MPTTATSSHVMSPVCCFAIVLCLFRCISAATLDPEHSRHQWSRSNNSLSSIVSDAPSNSSSATATNIPFSDRNPVVCNQARYGADLSIESCADALRQIPQDSVQRSWGQRGAGTYDVNLPHRYLGMEGNEPASKSTVRGFDVPANSISVHEVLCAIDVVRRGPDHDSDFVSSQEIYQAATLVFEDCVRGRVPHSAARNSGGVAGDIGTCHQVEKIVFCTI